MIWLLAAAWANPPTMCDPAQDTAPVEAAGFCLTEEQFVELAQLKRQAATLGTENDALRAELLAFEGWQALADQRFQRTVESMTEASNTAVDLAVSRCAASLERCERSRKRTFLERHGFGIGVAVGLVGAVAVTAATLQVYGDVLQQE